MSTARRRAKLARLVEGEHLEQPEFHERYKAMPPGIKAELIDGVVYMASPVSRDHGQSHGATGYWLFHYAGETPGVEAGDNASTILGRRSEPQPDGLLRIQTEFGGQSTIERGYIQGAPELIAEIAKASRYVDLGPKLKAYERAGVQEYVVRAFRPDDVLWFRRIDGAFVPIKPGADGLYRSEVFPGLWLDPAALLAGDVRRLRQVVDQGVATPEHAEFVARLARHRQGS